MLPDDPRHGTYAGSNAHWDDGEDACDSCRWAASRYQKVRKLRILQGEEALVPSIGTRRRLQALAAIGHGFAAIAREMGCTREEVRRWATADHGRLSRRTHERVSEVYERLSMRPANPATQSDKRATTLALNMARRGGWLPPLSWDDIDDPDERPTVTRDRTWGAGNWEDHVDHAVVWRVINEQSSPRKLTRAESAEVVRILLSRGVSTFVIENDYGVNVARVERKAS